MKTLALILVLGLTFIAVQAAGIPQKSISNQQNYQASCVQKRISICIKKLCGNKAIKNCNQVCKKTLGNECRYAGE
jgi:hypothetical protein